MSSPLWQSQVVPARLNFLAIYNPSLGPTDDTFRDQLVFWYSRAAREARITNKKNARNDAAGGDAIREEENEKLRQIGLAQGMVDFARSFSDDRPVDSIDTEKSRIVLHEIEKGWWILASVDLTRLPSLTQSSSESSKKGTEKNETKPAIEYASREVSPPALLVQQLVQAHHVFALHHGYSLDEIYIKLSRDKLCGMLERYWARFSRTWDVLLHGNPASDIFSGVKLSSGGELGMGVGEEEWGSGERDVLEDLTRRTEGLVDLIVSRFGDPAPSNEEAALSDTEPLPWMGSGNYPLASDGVIFGGINGIARPSLRNVSLWMRQIYTYGDYAYGVRDNPHRERRKRRRRNPPAYEPEPEPEPSSSSQANGLPKAASVVSARDHASPTGKASAKSSTQRLEDASLSQDADCAAQEGYHPGIPPPIVTAAQQSLDRATKKAGSSERVPQVTPDDGTTLGIPDQYMKYLTFGLSTLAKPTPQGRRPDPVSRTSTSSSKTIRAHQQTGSNLKKTEEVLDTDDDQPMLSQVDPTPDGQDLQDKIAIQKRQEENGLFVVGLKGDFDNIPDDPDASIDDVDDEEGGPRNILRTLQIEVVKDTETRELEEEARTDLDRKLSDAGLSSAKNDPLNYKRLRVLVYVRRPFMYCFLFNNQTPSLSIARFYKDLHSNLLPIHKPLLSSTSVERIAQRIAESQQEATPPTSDTASITSTSTSRKAAEPKPIYDLIYDPALLTVHTSIPNIAEPGTPAAEGILPTRKDTRLPYSADWTRIEALNVHSQVLNTLASTNRNPNEYERTSKTSRGWWIVWLKLSASKTRETAAGDEAASSQNVTKESGGEDTTTPGEPEFTEPLEAIQSDDTAKPSTSKKWLESYATSGQKEAPSLNRIAFLVRKATDSPTPAAKSTTSSRAASSMWQALTLRSGPSVEESTGGASAGWGPAALAGGIGIDARKYVEGLLQLNR